MARPLRMKERGRRRWGASRRLRERGSGGPGLPPAGDHPMENALLIGLSRQVALSRELDVIANNVANIGTAGFKARALRFEEYIMPGASADTFNPADQPLSYVVDKGSGLDFSSGAVERTGRELDV